MRLGVLWFGIFFLCPSVGAWFRCALSTAQRMLEGRWAIAACGGSALMGFMVRRITRRVFGETSRLPLLAQWGTARHF